MLESAIIIIYHEYNDLTLYHYKRFKYFNPDIPVIMIKHEDFEELPFWNYDWMWGYNDNILYRWFLSKERVDAERYFVFDYDTYPNDSIKNYYCNVWNKQFACSDHFSIKQYKNWSWFEKYGKILEEYKEILYGICPPSGMMIRRDDLNNIINEQINNPIWKNIFLELRLGTLLRLCNVDISYIDENKKQYISPFTHVVPSDYASKPGIYHPVKKITMNNNINTHFKNDIQFFSAAYPIHQSFENLTKGLRLSNNRYKSFNINFYGQNNNINDFKSLYNAKIINLLDILENKCNADIVGFIDSQDTFLNKDLDQNFIETFESFNCKMIFGAETNCYPIEQLNIFDNNNSEFKYLNSGMFIGYRDFIISVLKKCIEHYNKFPQLKTIGWGAPNDQLFFWMVYVGDMLYSNNNNIKLDYDNKLFLNVYGKNIDSDFDYNNQVLTIKEKQPYIVHAAGVYKIEAYKIMLKKLGYNI